MFLLFFLFSHFSRQAVCPTKRKMKFMVLDMVYLRHALDDLSLICRQQQWTFIIIPKIMCNRHSNFHHRNQTSKSFIPNSICHNICHSNFSMYLLVSKGVCLDKIFHFVSFCTIRNSVCCVFQFHVFQLDFFSYFLCSITYFCRLLFVRSNILFICVCLCVAYKVLRFSYKHRTSYT